MTNLYDDHGRDPRDTVADLSAALLTARAYNRRRRTGAGAGQQRGAAARAAHTTRRRTEMTDTTTTTTTFRIGIADRLHAIACDPTDPATGRHYPTACGGTAVIATEWGMFRRGNPHLRPHDLCAHCTWTVALADGTEEQELAAIRPTPAEATVWGRLLPDPHLLDSTCRTILAARAEEAGYDEDHPRWAQLLGHVTAHRPEVLTTEDCAERCCDHPDEAACYADDVTLACPTCSVKAGPWAGEWEGQAEIVVPAPCSVLTVMGAATFR
jgi:hypothetical protein